MMDKGIVMCGDMVRALLAKRKFRTMRPMNEQPPAGYEYKGDDGGNPLLPKKSGHYWMNGYAIWRPNLERYRIGDRLYVKEGYQIDEYSFRRNCVGGKYLADNKEFWTEVYQREYDLINHRKYPYRKTPGRFMYKSLARIWMTVTKVTVQRPQELTAKEWVDEGIYDPRIGWADQPDVYIMLGKNLRDSLHGEGSYDRNEWCFVPHWENIEIKGD